MSVITGSRSSYSSRSVAQPSTTRNTSPNGSSATPGRPRAAGAGTTPSSRCPARRSAAPARRAASASRRRSGGRRSGRARPATPPTCGRSRSDAQRAAAEVQAVDLHLGRRVGERQPADQRAQRGATCRSARRRRSRRARPAPASCSHIRSRRCSRGLSISAIGTCSAPCSSGLAKVRPRTGSTATGPSSSSSVGGLGQRRQPHLVRRRALAGQPGHHDVQQALAGRRSPPASGWTGLTGFGTGT